MLIHVLFPYHIAIESWVVQFRIETLNSISSLVYIYNSILFFTWSDIFCPWELWICIAQFVVLFLQTFLSFLVWNLRLTILSWWFMNISSKWILWNIIKNLFLLFFYKSFRIFDYGWFHVNRIRVLFLIKVKWNLSFLSLRFRLNY